MLAKIICHIKIYQKISLIKILSSRMEWKGWNLKVEVEKMMLACFNVI